MLECHLWNDGSQPIVLQVCEDIEGKWFQIESLQSMRRQQNGERQTTINLAC
jgi:hypothetical protein